MTALSQERDTPETAGRLISHPVAASTKIFAGALVMLNATGYATKGQTAVGFVTVGRAEATADNSAGANGDIDVATRRGTFRFANDGSVTRTEIGKTCYVVDDQTVAKTDGTGTRSAAGVVRNLDALGVWVEI